MRPLVQTQPHHNRIIVNLACASCGYPGSHHLDLQRATALMCQLSEAIKEIRKREAEAKQCSFPLKGV